MGRVSALSMRVAGAIAMWCVFSIAQAHEPPSGLLARFTFEDSLADDTGNGFTAEMVGADAATPPSPRFVEGRFGRALAFDGERSVRIPLDLHYDRYPEVTITGWVYLDSEDSRGALVGTGGGDGPQIRVNGDDIFASHTNGFNRANGVLRPGQWLFFAGSWDYRSGTNRLNWRARSQTEPFEIDGLDPPAQDVWLGSIADLRTAAVGLALDDVRIYGRVLTDEELEGLQLGPDEQISSTGTQLPGGQTIDPALLEGLSVDEATALQRELEMLIESASDSGSAATSLPEGVVADTGIDIGATTGEREFTADEPGPDLTIAAEAEGLEPEQELRATVVQTTADQITARLPPEEEGPDDGTDSSGWRFSATDVRRTPVSGARGQIVVPEEESEGIHAISIGERNNVPCNIAFGAGLDIQECGYALSFDQELETDIAPATIGGLRVCSNQRDNQRVKGIEIRGNVIRRDGSLGEYRQNADEHTNCRQWETLVLCPTGYLATGVVGHFNPRQRGSNELVGLQLICRRIVPE